MTHCCAECGEEGGIALKTCKSCMLVRYCNTNCQKNHWATHKKDCKLRAAELRDEALFKDPPSKEDCPICFLPMPAHLICCVSLPPATATSVPIFDYAIANEDLATEAMEEYHPCCGKSICRGCMHSFSESGNDNKCPFCNSDRNKTEEERVHEMMRRVEANDPASICMLAGHICLGRAGFQQDHAKAMELYAKAADLGFSKAHSRLGMLYHERGNFKKAKFHFEAAAMAGCEVSRYNLGQMEALQSGNIEQAVKHWTIGASGGHYDAMNTLIKLFERGIGIEIGYLSRESIDSALKSYNNSCAEMRSEARDACIQFEIDRI